MAAINELRSWSLRLSAAAAAVVLGACASTQLEAQWADPGMPANVLHGQRVLVACEAYDTAIQRICEEQLVQETTARGATPIVAPDTTHLAPGRPLDAEQYLAAARRAGAKAVLVNYIAPSASNVSPGVMIGIGGFGMGGGGFGGGVGISAPIGGGQTTIGYSASARLTDAASGRLWWTARASSPPSQDVRGQLSQLAQAVFAAADKAQVF